MHHDMRKAAFRYVVELKYPLFLAIVVNCLRGLGDEPLSTRFLVLRMLLDGYLCLGQPDIASEKQRSFPQRLPTYRSRSHRDSPPVQQSSVAHWG